MVKLTCRYYESECDLQEMEDMLMEGRSLTNDWRYWHVGELLFNFFMVACHLNPREHVRLWHESQKLVGFAILGEDPSFDCQLLPDYEWMGIENEALTWALLKIEALHKEDPAQWGGDLVSGSRQDDQSRIAFLENHGFCYRGDFTEVNMLRSVEDPIPDLDIPEGYQVREVAENGDLSNRASAQREVWKPWSVGNVSDADYAFMMQMPGYRRDLDIVTVAETGVIVAYGNGWIDPVNRIGDFGPVGALPGYRRQGLTRLALLECMRRMKAHNMNRICVSTGVSNIAARNLYESIGFKVVNKYLDFIRVN